MFQAVTFAPRGSSYRCGQYINMRAVEKFFLNPVVALALGELLEGQLAVERDDARQILLELAGEDEAPLCVVLALQFFNRFGRPLDEIRQADAEFDDAAVVRVIQRFGDNAAVIEQWPERIAPARVVVATADRRPRVVCTPTH